ncbi:AT-hook motif nuclear-localized protein 11-like [Dioscorea cayenensis subsp. rotundata]|uniref:AT-hook motif nuclear-localized protein n=1 Tax=Dioscorea cayennensis subsp. rotundata TaxID=55577 RepID=A0AB40AYT5_DIOCR|nr:AT-hook motif nuclear-localized protein 11-like [Dioscorea cayenensis subsp. rotundata]
MASNYAAAAAMDAVPMPRRGSGRSSGSGSRQRLSSPGNSVTGPVGMGLMNSYMIIIDVGENIAEKIISFAEEGPKHLCILSVNGSVSSATLLRPSTAGGVVTYEGTSLDILSLSGSLTPDEDGESVTGVDGLNITLSSSDGRVIGGRVGDVLIAATRVQVVVGVFNALLKKKTESDTDTDLEIEPEIEPETSNMPARQKQASVSRRG